MRVKNILNNKSESLITISATASLLEAAEMISTERVGMLLVVDETGKLVGLISERDIVGFIAKHSFKQNLSALDFAVTAAMATNWLSATLDDSVTNLMRMMTEKRARHVPVLTDGKLIGVISIGDILKSRLAEKDQEAEVLRDIAVSSLIASAYSTSTQHR